MTAAVVALVKTGRITNVVPFGSQLPTPPYVVVKDEAVPGMGRRLRVITHMEQGQQIMLEDYVREDLLTLLDGVKLTSRHGAVNVLAVEDEPSGLVIDNDDGTISRERCFLLPSRQF